MKTGDTVYAGRDRYGEIYLSEKRPELVRVMWDGQPAWYQKTWVAARIKARAWRLLPLKEVIS